MLAVSSTTRLTIHSTDMKQQVKSPIHLKEAQLFLEECKRTHELVTVVALTMEGEIHHYEGWQVISSWWQRGTHDLLNPKNGQKRKVRDVLIFEINGHPVYQYLVNYTFNRLKINELH